MIWGFCSAKVPASYLESLYTTVDCRALPQDPEKIKLACSESKDFFQSVPSCRTLMLLNKAESSQVLMQAIRLDANGFILRTVSTDEFIDQLKLVHSGGMAASDKITAALADHLRTRVQKKPAKDPSITQLLTNREYEVLCCVASGLANREIAQVLKITDGTVKVHVKHLLKKLKFRSRVEAAVWASEHDFRLSPDQLTQYGFDPQTPGDAPSPGTLAVARANLTG